MSAVTRSRLIGVVVASIAYNGISLLGGSGTRLNLLGLVISSVAAVGFMSLGRRLSTKHFDVMIFRGRPVKKRRFMFLRRLGVFLVGGYFCPRCGHAEVRPFLGWLTCYACRGCGAFYLGAADLTPREAWRRVWKSK